MNEAKFDIVFDSQKVFRTLLDTFAYPGKVVRIPDLKIVPPEGISKAPVGVLLTLLDHEAGFAVSASDKKQRKKIEEYLILNTGSRLKELESADFILTLGELPQLRKIKRGSLEYPDEGATIVYVVEEIGESLSEINSVSLTLSGPGINGKRKVASKGLKKQEFMKIMEINKGFPLGIDFVFADRKDKFFALPRSTKIVEVKEALSTYEEIQSTRKGGVKEA